MYFQTKRKNEGEKDGQKINPCFRNGTLKKKCININQTEISNADIGFKEDQRVSDYATGRESIAKEEELGYVILNGR